MDKEDPTVTYRGALDMQVCVPSEWIDSTIEAFANLLNSCGTTTGWQIRKQGDLLLDGRDERVPCQDKEGYVHVMLDA